MLENCVQPVPGICRLLDSQKRSAVSYDSSKFKKRSWKIDYMIVVSFFFSEWCVYDYNLVRRLNA